MSQDALFGFPEAVPGFGSVTPVHISAAADFIRRHHYLHRPGAASFAFGLWHDIRMVGVCTYGTIITKNAAAICGPRWAERVLELTRLVLLDDTPRNSESYFIAQTFKALPHPQILLSYADTDAGDIGTIYQATNWSYTGVTTKGSYVTADGERLHARSVSDARKGVNAASSGKALKWEDASPKHRYVTFIGSRSEKRAMRRAMSWPIQPYPKAVTPDARPPG